MFYQEEKRRKTFPIHVEKVAPFFHYVHRFGASLAMFFGSVLVLEIPSEWLSGQANVVTLGRLLLGLLFLLAGLLYWKKSEKRALKDAQALKYEVIGSTLYVHVSTFSGSRKAIHLHQITDVTIIKYFKGVESVKIHTVGLAPTMTLVAVKNPRQVQKYLLDAIGKTSRNKRS